MKYYLDRMCLPFKMVSSLDSSHPAISTVKSICKQAKEINKHLELISDKAVPALEQQKFPGELFTIDELAYSVKGK